MKRILILSVSYFPFVGGAEVAVKEITDRIADWQFDMLTARMDRKLPRFERIGSVDVYRIGFGFKALDKYIYTFFGFFKALKLHFKNHYEIVWPIMAAYSSFAVLFKLFFPKIKILLTLQEGDPIEYITRLKRIIIFWPVYRFYFRKADRIQTISNFLADWAKKLRGNSKNIVVIPNGVDLKEFSSFAEASALFKQELGIKETEKVLITTSRLVEKNAVADIIDAMKFLPENTKLLILGVGPEEENLKARTKILNLGSRVMFVGAIGHGKLLVYLKISDVFVRPSLSEGLGISFLEAMAAGIPIIGTPVGGIIDFLKDGETGLFCEVKNPKSIAEKVKLLLANNDLREKIITNAKKLIEEKYDWDLIAGKMKEAFNGLIL